MAQVLIIDDSTFQKSVLTRIVQKAGHTAIAAANGEDGLDLVAERSPDCILLDLLMPGMGGLKFLEILSGRDDPPPVIVITADVQESVQQRCLELGASAVLHKPPKEEALHDAISSALGLERGAA